MLRVPGLPGWLSLTVISNMNEKLTTIVDFVAKGDSPDEWKMVLVEEGPWFGPDDEHLHQIQQRMYGCIDAALDGQLAEDFPESKGLVIVVQLDCYNVPRPEVEIFFQRFSSGIFLVDDYKRALENNQYVRNIRFEINFEDG